MAARGPLAKVVGLIAAVASLGLASTAGSLPGPAGAALPVNAPDAVITLDAGTPQALRVDPSTGKVFIATGDEVEVLNSSGGFVGRVPNQFGASAFAQVGRTLYVALGGTTSISAVNMDTLAVSHTWSLAPDTQLRGLAFAGGKLWFTAQGSGSSFGGLFSLDPGTGTVAPSGLSHAPAYLTAKPDTNTLLMSEVDSEPSTLYTVDVSGTPKVVHSLWNVSENLAQLTLSADGKTVWVAGGAPYQVNEYNAETATSTGITYQTSPYPVSVANVGNEMATASDFGDSTTNANVWVFPVGAPTAAWLGQTSPTNQPARAGIGFAPNGRRLYVATQDGHLDLFNLTVGPPSAPTGVSAVAGVYSATVSWNAPSDAGGSVITSYTITPYINGFAQTPMVVSGSALSQTITGLTAGTTYAFKVTATNNFGVGTTSAASNAATPTVPPTLPGAPSITSVTASSKAASVSWNPPSSDGGAPITSYRVTGYAAGGVQTTLDVSGGATQADITGLTNGTPYTFTVAARNSVGFGANSAASSPVTPHAAAPTAPIILTAVPSHAQVALTWAAPASDGGSPVNDYVVTPRIGGVAQPSTTFNGTSGTVTGLTDGTAYTFTVVAENAVGPSPASAAAGPVTPRGHTPSAAFVDAAYADFLNRAPSAAELGSLTSGLDAGTTTRAQVVAGLSSSSEWVSSIVSQLYVNTLGRAGDAGGTAYWTDQIRSGKRTVAQVAANFYASDEYYNGIGGGTDSSWMTDLYHKLLHRDPDAAGLAYWLGEVRAKGRVSVALRVFGSSESCHSRVASLYQKLLGRGPDQAGWDYWSQQVAISGDIKLAANLASSPEYDDRAQTRYP